MARVIVSSSALLHEAAKVDSFRCITLAVRGGMMELHSTFHYHSKVPVETRADYIEACVRASDLVEILRGIEDQPITLDLHSGSYWQSAGKVYAAKRGPGEGYTSIEFTLPAYDDK